MGVRELYLNKHEVPYFNARRIVIVDQRCNVTIPNSIKMYFSAGSTRTSITHLPKVVLLEVTQVKTNKYNLYQMNKTFVQRRKRETKMNTNITLHDKIILKCGVGP